MATGLGSEVYHIMAEIGGNSEAIMANEGGYIGHTTLPQHYHTTHHSFYCQRHNWDSRNCWSGHFLVVLDES